MGELQQTMLKKVSKIYSVGNWDIVYCLCNRCKKNRLDAYETHNPEVFEVLKKFPNEAVNRRNKTDALQGTVKAEAERKKQEAERRKNNEAKRKQEEAKRRQEEAKRRQEEAARRKELEHLFKKQKGSLQNPLYEGKPYYAYEMGEGNQH